MSTLAGKDFLHTALTRLGVFGALPILVAACSLGAQAQDAAADTATEDATDTAQPAADDSATADEPAKAPSWFRGYFRTSLDVRHSQGDSDVFLDQVLRLTVQPPDHPNVRLHLGTWSIEDLDGHESRTSTISTLHNTFDASLQVRLLHLYLEADDLIGDSVLRIGRQRILDGPAYNRIDGLYFKRQLVGWSYYVFGGARASLYDAGHDDLTLGGGVAFDLTRRTRLAVDLFYGEDEQDEVRRGFVADLFGRSFPRRVKADTDSRMVSVTLDHQWSPQHHVYGRYTVFDGQSDEIVVTASGVMTWRETVYDVTLRRRANTLGDRANDVTGYYRILGEQDEFTELYASVYIPLNERFTLGLDGQIRETDGDSDDWGNRDFQRVAATLDVREIAPGLDGSLTASWWHVNDEEGSFALTGDLTKQWEQWKLTVGVDFERWEDRVVEYNPYALPATRIAGFFSPFVRSTSYLLAGLFDTDVVETHENVYTGYVRAEYALKEHQTLSFDLSVQEDDGPDSPYWRFEAAYRISF